MLMKSAELESQRKRFVDVGLCHLETAETASVG